MRTIAQSNVTPAISREANRTRITTPTSLLDPLLPVAAGIFT